MYNAYTAKDAVAVVPSDTAQLFFTRLYVGLQGDVTVTTEFGSTVTFKNLQGWLELRVTQVHATNTTAQDIVGLY